MPENEDPADISERLRLIRPGLPSHGNSLRARGVRFPAVAAATAEAAASAPAADARKAATAHEVPGIVMLIGLYEFVRAVTLSVIYGMMLSDPHTHMFSEGFWTAFYVLSNGAPAVTPFLPVTIIYAFAVGTCLWMRANWGRRALIATSCWAVIRLGAFLFFYATLDPGVKASDPLLARIDLIRDAAFMLAAVNILIGLFMGFGPGVAEAFAGQKTGGRG
jgi:hypothetical protein